MQGIHEGPKYLLELGDQRLLWLFFFVFVLFVLFGGGVSITLYLTTYYSKV